MCPYFVFHLKSCHSTKAACFSKSGLHLPDYVCSGSYSFVNPDFDWTYFSSEAQFGTAVIGLATNPVG